jgi:hypothetical protein
MVRVGVLRATRPVVCSAGSNSWLAAKEAASRDEKNKKDVDRRINAFSVFLFSVRAGMVSDKKSILSESKTVFDREGKPKKGVYSTYPRILLALIQSFTGIYRIDASGSKSRAPSRHADPSLT